MPHTLYTWRRNVRILIKDEEGIKKKKTKKTYCITDETIGHSKLQSDTGATRLSRYIIRSHQAGMRFFSPESYPVKNVHRESLTE